MDQAWRARSCDPGYVELDEADRGERLAARAGESSVRHLMLEAFGRGAVRVARPGSYGRDRFGGLVPCLASTWPEWGRFGAARGDGLMHVAATMAFTPVRAGAAQAEEMKKRAVARDGGDANSGMQ